MRIFVKFGTTGKRILCVLPAQVAALEEIEPTDYDHVLPGTVIHMKSGKMFTVPQPLAQVLQRLGFALNAQSERRPIVVRKSRTKSVAAPKRQRRSR